MVKFFFISFLIIHGLIHFLGFVKTYNIGNLSQFDNEISKPIGNMWFLSGFMFLICAALYLVEKNSWTITTAITVLLSQVLIINNWQDSRFGTIPNVIILLVAIVGFFQIKFKNEYKNEVKKSMIKNQNMPSKLLSEFDIAGLPPPIQKYIRYTGCLEKPVVYNFKIQFAGKIRSYDKNVWMPLVSEQYNFVKTTTRLFFLDATMNKLPVSGFHCFDDGMAYMDIRLLSMFKVQYHAGKVMDISETVTFFNDMCVMAPATLIDKRIQWLDYDNTRVKASFSYNEITISAWLYFNEKGELIDFVSEDRYALEANGKTTRLKWSTPLRDYKVINGHTLASHAEAIYSYPDVDFTYATFELKNIAYNVIQ